VANMEIRGYVTGGWTTKEKLDECSVDVNRYESDLDSVLRTITGDSSPYRRMEPASSTMAFSEKLLLGCAGLGAISDIFTRVSCRPPRILRISIFSIRSATCSSSRLLLCTNIICRYPRFLPVRREFRFLSCIVRENLL